MGGASLPPGFRFHPTDEELVGYYLKRKLDGLEIELEVIPVVDLYKSDPWELPEKSFLPKGDKEWFFFCPRDRKYQNGSRTNRATRAGYWKATGKDRKIVCHSSPVIGYRKTLVFYLGRAPAGDRTDWMMHEYRLSDDFPQGSQSFQGPYALCRILKKNEQAKQIGSCSRNGDSNSTRNLSEPVIIISDDIPCPARYNGSDSNYSSALASTHQTMPTSDSESAPLGTNPSSLWVSPDFILDSSKDFAHGEEGLSRYIPQNDMPNSMTQLQPHEQFEISPSSSYSNFTDKVELADDHSQFSCMSPDSRHEDYVSFFGNGSVSHEGYGWFDSLNQKTF